MGIFSKKRHGEMSQEGEDGRRFVWRIEKFSKYKLGSTLDSDNVVCFSKVKFHFHMTLDANGDIGLYLHYKTSGIPKYSYYFENAKGEMMRQQTAHTIPPETERCGHWNACYHADALTFIGEEDVLQVHLCFDEDTMDITRSPQSNTLTVRWTIPSLFKQVLNPYSSKGFLSDRHLLVLRLEVKKETGSPDAFSVYNLNNIKEFVFFIFCRAGRIPPHSIELLNDAGKRIAKLDKREEDGAQTLTVPKAEMLDVLGENGVLQVVVELHSCGNPLDTFNLLSGAPKNSQENEAENPCALTRTVKIEGESEEFIAMSGDR